MSTCEHKPGRTAGRTGEPGGHRRLRGRSPAGWLVVMAALLAALGGAALPLAQPQPGHPAQAAGPQASMAWAHASPWRFAVVAGSSSGERATQAVQPQPGASEPPRVSQDERWPARLSSPAVWALARLPARLLCEGVAGGARSLPDAATLARDQAAAFARLMPELLSHPEPLYQAVGLYGLGRLDRLVPLALSTPDPRVAALAMLGCHAQAERSVAPGRASHRSGATPSACKEPMARRWTQLAPGNAAAWAALASALLDAGRVAEIEPVLRRIEPLRAWESYPHLVQAVLIDAMPADFSWWQRWGETYGLSEVGRAIRPGHLSAAYCTTADEDETDGGFGPVDATRLPVCAILARRMADQRSDEHIAWSGLDLKRHLALELSAQERIEDEARFERLRNSSRERTLRSAALTDEDASSCAAAARQVRRAMRVHVSGGLRVAEEESRRYEARLGAVGHAPADTARN